MNLSGLAVVLVVGLGVAGLVSSATAQEEPEMPPPFAPSEADLACETDDDCVVTCSLDAYWCCPSYCTPCTFVLNREAMQRREEACAAENPDCPVVGGCAWEPTERGVARCLEGHCSVELVPVESAP